MDRKKGKLKKIESVLPVAAKIMGLDFRMKEFMVMNYWPEIARGELGKDTRPHSIVKTRKGLVLYIATKSSMVSQELNLVKLQLLDKINILAAKVGINVVDIVFSTKYWPEAVENEGKQNSENAPRSFQEAKKELNLQEVELTIEEMEYINNTLSQLDLDDEIRDRMKSVMERDLKLKKSKNMAGMPSCKNCGVTLGEYQQDLCPACRF